MSTAVTHRARASMSIKKDKTPLVLAFARVVYAAMLADATRFPAPIPVLILLLAQITALDLAEQAIATSLRGTATAARNVARDVLWASLRSLQAYVQTVADADMVNGVVIIKSSGFNIAKQTPRDKAILSAVLDGLPGVVKLEGNVRALTGGSKKRATYNWQYSVDGGHTWIPVLGTPKGTTTISGLPLMTNVSFRVSVTQDGVTQPWTQSVTIAVN